MTIAKFYTTTFEVRRLTYTSGIGEYGASHTFKGHLQQASQEQSISQQLQPSLAYSIWCAPDTNVKLNDTLRVGGRDYSVVAIMEHNTVGDNQHLELLVERSDVISA